MIDTNVYMGHWPFRHHSYEHPAELVRKLKSGNISSAWVGSFEGVFHEDLAGANARLTEACQEHGKDFLVPIGSVNPKLPDWQEDVRRCHEVHRMPGIRLNPNYHNYKLDDPAVPALLEQCAKRKLFVQIAVRLEDDRTQHPLMIVPPVDLAPLAGLLPRIPGLKIHLQNVNTEPRTEALLPLVRSGEVYFDIAMFETVAVITRLIDRVGQDRVLFGSFFPLFLLESSILKVKEAALSEPLLRKLQTENARKLANAK